MNCAVAKTAVAGKGEDADLYAHTEESRASQ